MHLKNIIEGKVEGSVGLMGRWGRRCTEVWGYWKLKGEALGHTLWRTRLKEAMDLSQDILWNE